jgi:hypothetical protein
VHNRQCMCSGNVNSPTSHTCPCRSVILVSPQVCLLLTRQHLINLRACLHPHTYLISHFSLLLSLTVPPQIYSWQGVNALELWARVLGAHAGKPELRPLVYPLVQVSEKGSEKGDSK